jgi:hypothetical protein
MYLLVNVLFVNTLNCAPFFLNLSTNLAESEYYPASALKMRYLYVLNRALGMRIVPGIDTLHDNSALYGYNE